MMQIMKEKDLLKDYRTLKNKSYKYMTLISKYIYTDKLDHS